MNERIKQLALECGAWQQVYEPQLFMHDKNFDITKFAELIVRDCMLICEDVMKKDNSALGCWSEIKRKFRS